MIFKKESQVVIEEEEKKEEKPKRTKSRFFYPDTFYRDVNRKEMMEKDPDFKAFHRDKW